MDNLKEEFIKSFGENVTLVIGELDENWLTFRLKLIIQCK